MQKVFKAILKYIKENVLYLLFLVAIVVVFTYKLPYETCDQPLDFSFSKLDDDSEEKLFIK